MGSIKDIKRYEKGEGALLKDLTQWILSVDRRLDVIRALEGAGPFNATEISHRTGRSIQNVSRAIHELEEKGLLKCLTPEKQTWKRYLLTEKGKSVLSDLRNEEIVQ